ncbi:MFS transporter [Plantactinospora sonchi]|uniref:Major facilitator superfamily (MFS) profile domain-containing protein n=1 Tax=Plantactinospora sonchi TaxID=1544735 RepID=A0ABU7S0D8_9ACTN
MLATVVTFALLGALFALPQYFQAVLDADALGTGLRLLPLIGGVLLGARLGARLVPRLGARVPVAIGFLVLAAGLFAGTATGTGTGYAFVAGWLTAVGLGMGLVLPIASDIALGTLSVERSGAGSALIQALRQVGGTIGVATLGSVLNAVYRDRLDPAGLPAPAAEAARDSAPAGVLVARQLDAPALLDSVRDAFVDALAAMLWVCGGLGLLGAVLAIAFLPRRTGPVTAAPVGRPAPETGESGQVTVG